MDDPKIAAKCLILFKEKYLLVLRAPKENIDPSVWDIPGGGVEKGETALETVIREVREETGIDISSSKNHPVKNWTLEKNGIKLSGIDFLCVLDNYQEVRLSSEHVSFKWLSEEEIMKSKEVPSWLKESISLAAAKMAD